MDFHPNSHFLYILAAAVIAFVIAQSVFFLVRAYRRARALQMDMARIRRVIVSTALFTVAPAVSILLGVVTLSKFLGLPLPWIRLSVIGAITYELPAATSAAAALGASLSQTVTDPAVYTAIAWVMTLGILPSIVLVPLVSRRIQRGLIKIRTRDSVWGELFVTAMFLGMISAFLGMVFSGVREGIAGWVPVFVLLFSALIMALIGWLIRLPRMAWLKNYALPVSMLGAMAFAAFITPLIG